MARRSAPRRESLVPLRTLAFAAIAFCLASCATPVSSPRASTPSRTVYVINHSILHTGIALQRSDIPPGTLPVSHDYKGSRYLEVGWGEDDGYRKPLSPRTAFHALRGSSRTVLLCDGFDQPASQGRAVVAIDLTERGFDRLTRHIAQTFALDDSGQPQRLEENWYRARGRYSAFHNCNNWVAAGLRAAGCPINARYASPHGLFSYRSGSSGATSRKRSALGGTSGAKRHRTGSTRPLSCSP